MTTLYAPHIGQYRSSEREREREREREKERERDKEREMLLNLKQNVCCKKCISELFEILTCCDGY